MVWYYNYYGILDIQFLDIKFNWKQETFTIHLRIRSLLNIFNTEWAKSIDASRNSIFHNKIVVKVEFFVANIHVKKVAIGIKKFYLDYALNDSKFQKINTKDFFPKNSKKYITAYDIYYYQ